jgi:peptidoglycan/LPS O-acetylase OafA/YrhL
MRTKQVGEEIRALTGLRGIAAIYVMIFHFVPLVSFSGLEMTFIGHGYLAVDLFFVLSGFVMALNYGRMFEARWTARTYMTFLGRRIARVYPLYLVATVCGCGLVSTGYLEGFDTTPIVKTFVFNVLMVQSWGFAGSFDAPAWSISAEFAA